MAECQSYNHKVTGSNFTSGYGVPMPTQHAIILGSVNQ